MVNLQCPSGCSHAHNPGVGFSLNSRERGLAFISLCKKTQAAGSKSLLVLLFQRRRNIQ